MMSEVNPFESPKAVDPQYEKLVNCARTLLQVRSVKGQLSRFELDRKTVLIRIVALLTSIAVGLFVYFLSQFWGTFVLGALVGVMVGTFRFSRFSDAREWEQISQFIDWRKVENAAGTLGDFS